ncbi:asparagine--tRNA ligase [Desulfonatronum sp. SC1]|uniref:asparagine--tRNA ligase n=1 Tax=Desulfonatronum sp. SC1 TaxID=2109626 RepID=UPI000D2FFA34|nr:asparagine--tRNA ligase [Desulfonatronum sp. SC1]PTN37833.1 asparagine--tRNA ligase [Desulfonatronum sp. SC1]
MNRTSVFQAVSTVVPLGSILLRGWVRTRRDAKEVTFLEINDGSCLMNVQVVVDHAVADKLFKDVNTGASVEIHGEHVASPAAGQSWEVRAERVVLICSADQETYPLQKKRHSDEFLRTIAHLRPRTNKYGAMARIRSEAAFAVHDFFRGRGFWYLHAPILTGSDCEGAGEMFRVTSLPPEHQPKPGADVHAEDFFGRQANLTVSGQLEAELYACALGKVYTFGPTFRAENSNTPRHAAEFWMIEPEFAFGDLAEDMQLAEDLTKAMVRHVMDTRADDLELFAKFVDKTLLGDLEILLAKPFARISYAQAIDILEDSKRDFEFQVLFGSDLQTEHERFLAEEHFKQPVIVYDYPRTIKPFYMRLNDDGETVAAMDLLVPRVGELVGGSQREERLNILSDRMDEQGLNKDAYWWYLDTRRFGSAPHAGFGMGFERFLMMITGATNIRDVIPFPRTPGHLEF